MLKIQPRLIKRFLRKPKTVYDLVEIKQKTIVDEQGDFFEQKINTFNTLQEALDLKNELEKHIYGE